MDQIKQYYPAPMAENAVFQKHILKEYVQLLTLDYLSTTEHIRKMTFICGWPRASTGFPKTWILTANILLNKSSSGCPMMCLPFCNAVDLM
jgi:hypothetical protein